MVKSSEKLAEEFGGGSKDNFVSRDHHWAASKVVITHELDVRESLIISKIVEDSLRHVCSKVVVGEMKQRSPHCGTIILKRSKFFWSGRCLHRGRIEMKLSKIVFTQGMGTGVNNKPKKIVGLD